MSRAVCVIRVFYPSFFFFTSWSPNPFFIPLVLPSHCRVCFDTAGLVVSVSVTIKDTRLRHHDGIITPVPPRHASRVLCIFYHTTAFLYFVYLPHNHIKVMRA